MNIFLDTTVLYKDYFLNKVKSKQLLEIAELGEVCIYISKVVLMETRRHFKNDLQEKLAYTQKALHEINRIPNLPTIDSMLPAFEDALAQFDQYYEQLEKYGIVNIVQYSGDMMDELVNRAVNRLKPFSENKSEFRDAVIWLSYAKLVEDENLEDCILVTGNSSDYLKGKELHPDLQKDTKRFRVIKDIHALLQDEAMKPHIVNFELQNWVENNTVTNANIFSALDEKENFNLLLDAVYDYTSNLQPEDIDEDYYGGGYVETDGIWIEKISEFDFEVVRDNLFINGIVTVKADLEGHVYVGEGEHFYIGTSTVGLDIQFAGEFDAETKKIYNLEIQDLYKVSIEGGIDTEDYPDSDEDVFRQ